MVSEGTTDMILTPDHIFVIYVTLIFAGIWRGLGFWHIRTGWPILAVANRWVRWMVFSLLFASVGHFMGKPEPEPIGLLFATGFLVYLLVETMYSWIAIGALSKSDMALFPTFRSNKDGDQWPSHQRYSKAKEWIRQNGFTRVQSIKAELDEQLHIRASVYENEDKTIRLQVLFIPQRNGSLAMCYVFSSRYEDDTRIITDNMFMPFGGFYPESWHLVRKPLVRGIESLFNRHNKRLTAAAGQIVPWSDEPLDDLNAQQKQLERTNTQAGFLVPRHQQEEYGKITGEGRYRIWKEIWMLNYLGLPSPGSFRDEKA